MKGFELLWIFSCFCFCCQCLCFNFWNYLISWCFFRYCNQINQKEKKEKLEETVLLAKAKLNFIKASVSKALINFYINHDAIVWVNNVLSEYNEIKRKHWKYWKCCEIYHTKTMEAYCVNCEKNTAKNILVAEKLNKIY